MNRFAMVFPGQGSQALGMLSDVAKQEPIVHELFEEASEALSVDLWRIVQEDETLLNETEYAQPAILTASYAIWKILQTRFHAQPIILSGHSLGEYSALLCAGVFSFQDAVKLVSLRGQFMQKAVQKGVGKMAAVIGLSNEEVLSVCEEATHSTNWILSPANYNANGQVVIAGHAEAVDRALPIAKAAGAKLVKELPVSVPSHCYLMQPAVEWLSEALQNISLSEPNIPVIRNIDAAVYSSVDDILFSLTQQLVMPVRWVECLKKIAAMHPSVIVECGPSKVLTGLNKRFFENVEVYSTGDVESLKNIKL